MKRWALTSALLLGFGALKAPGEHALLKDQRAAGFQAAQLNTQLRSQIGQMGFVAALSGFRAIMADLVWIRAGAAFEKTEWGRMKLLLESATQLQPKAVLFWEMAHFHMAYDAATSVRENTAAQPSEALRRKAEREYIKIGEQFLLNGIAFNPDSAKLHERLGTLYGKRLYDHAKAAEAFEACAKKPGALPYVRRFAAYELAEVPGREREAYEKLRSLFAEGESQRLPTLLRLLSRLEEKLAVPTEKRVYIRQSPTNANSEATR